MAYEPIFPVEGNLLGDPELRFTPNGTPVCNFRVGINDARPEQNNGKTNVHSLIAEITVWREMAENVATSLEKGMRITAKVRITELGAYIPKNGGDPVGTLKVEALEIGPSLRWATSKTTKVAGNRNQNQGGGNQQSGWGGNQSQGGGWGQNPNGGQQTGNDAWSGGQQNNQQGGGWGSDQAWGGGGNQGTDPWGQ